LQSERGNRTKVVRPYEIALYTPLSN
jgi:hypothetical protein